MLILQVIEHLCKIKFWPSDTVQTKVLSFCVDQYNILHPMALVLMHLQQQVDELYIILYNIHLYIIYVCMYHIAQNFDGGNFDGY